MEATTYAILLGGVVPAIFLGVSNVFQKLCAKEGIGTGPYLVAIGLTTALVGGAFTLFEKNAAFNSRSALFAGLFGVFWSLAIGCIAIALRRYNAQISQLVPLYNMNTLISVLISLFLLSEWQTISAGKILAASVLIVAGGILAATA
jgi:hypothetical protein